MYLKIELPDYWSQNVARILAERLLTQELPEEITEIQIIGGDETVTR